MTIKREYLKTVVNEYGHTQYQCPICGKLIHEHNLNPHIKKHESGYFMLNGNVKPYRHSKFIKNSHLLQDIHLQSILEDVYKRLEDLELELTSKE